MCVCTNDTREASCWSRVPVRVSNRGNRLAKLWENGVERSGKTKSFDSFKVIERVCVEYPFPVIDRSFHGYLIVCRF